MNSWHFCFGLVVVLVWFVYKLLLDVGLVWEMENHLKKASKTMKERIENTRQVGMGFGKIFDRSWKAKKAKIECLGSFFCLVLPYGTLSCLALVTLVTKGQKRPRRPFRATLTARGQGQGIPLGNTSIRNSIPTFPRLVDIDIYRKV